MMKVENNVKSKKEKFGAVNKYSACALLAVGFYRASKSTVESISQ